MSKKVCLLITAGILLAASVPAHAQMPINGAMPKVVWLYEESVRPAMNNVHERVEHSFSQFWAKAQVQPFLGLDSLSSTNETLFVSGYDSFGAFENDFQIFNKAMNGSAQSEFGTLERQEAGVINGIRSRVAVLQDELSCMTDRFRSELPKSRYFQIMSFRIQPGKDQDFASVAKFYRSAFEKGDYQHPFAIYRVVFGGQGSNYLVFVPMKSLKAIDDTMTTETAILKGMGEDAYTNIMKTAGEAVISEENNLYAFCPKMSNVSKDFAAVDPEFWTPKADIKAAPAPKATGEAQGPGKNMKDQAARAFKQPGK